MSLINQMLKDLEKRGGLNAETTFRPTINTTYEDEIVTAETKESHGKKAFIVISAVFVIVYMGVYFWIEKPAIKPINPQDEIVFNDATTITTAMDDNNEKALTQLNNNAVVAEIAAAIEAEIREKDGEVDQHQVQAMVAEAKQANPKIVKLNDLDETLGNQSATVNIAAQNKVVQTSKTDVVHKVIKQEPKLTKKVANATKKTTNTVVVDAHEGQASKQEKLALKEIAHKDTKLIQENTTSKALVIAEPNKIAKAVQVVKKPEINNKENTQEKLAKVRFEKTVRPQQDSENLYQKALNYVQQGRVSEAQDILASALVKFPANQDARQTLAALLLDNKRIKEAKEVLRQGLEVTPDHVDFRMAVARLEVELGEKPAALETLLEGADMAQNNDKYQAFLATMLQRADRHEEAIKHFELALNINRGMTNAFVGLGISLQALDRLEDAQVAYSHAQSNTTLSPNLKSFIDVRIKEVNQRISAR